ncbi:MAG: response regulator [Desulfobacteraceae bacterium]|jgi:hypothetical protein
MIGHLIQKTGPYDILIVDDTQENLELLNRILEARGYRVRLATSGRLALNSVVTKPPDLILLDVKMPEMDGFEVCRRLKSDAHSRHVPVIFISAHIETAKKVEGFKAGGVDYIAKPFEREEVLARVETQLRLHELTERLEQQVDRRTRQLRQEMLEREQAQAALSREAGINSATAELSRNLLSPSSVDDITFLVLEQAKHLTGSAFGYVGHIDPETGYLVCPTLTRDIWDKCRVADKDIVFKKFTGLWGWVLKNRKALMTNAPADDPRSSGTPPDHVPIHRFLSAPSLIDGTLVGQVAVANADNDYTDRERKVIERLADLYAIAIQRRRSEEELQGHREQLEKLVKERTAELEASNKELEAFAYSVSHDLRAPLRHIDGFVELLQKRIDDTLDEQSRHYMEAISDSAQKMGLLIDDLLSFSRMGRQTMAFRQVDLRALVDDIIRELAPDAAGRSIDWRINDLPAVNGDTAMLRMVLANLIANAFKFTQPREKARIEIGSQPGQNAETVIFVRDNGVGFDMTYAHKLFGVFQRLHRTDEFEGTGIGLANVRRIITQHGGRTWAEGKIDQGAVFYFALPLHDEQGGKP